jgi:hypothetical protein
MDKKNPATCREFFKLNRPYKKSCDQPVLWTDAACERDSKGQTSFSSGENLLVYPVYFFSPDGVIRIVK